VVSGIITATDRMLKIEKKFFLHLPVRLDDRSETWFNTFCVLIRSQTLVSAKDKVTCLIDYTRAYLVLVMHNLWHFAGVLLAGV